jgi:hypothetical protein
MTNLLIGISAVVAVLVVVIATRPATFHVERSIVIGAPPENAFARVNDFHAWAAWSPWEALDPGMQRTFAGAPSGAGAVYAWAGNKDVGKGRMTIEHSVEPSRIAIKLEFLEPWAATNAATFTCVPVTDGTKVTWAMDGRNNFVAKAFHLVMDMDGMVGGYFERGLSALKTIAEDGARAGGQPLRAVQ